MATNESSVRVTDVVQRTCKTIMEKLGSTKGATDTDRNLLV
jgi:hypothetical protein